MNKEELIKRCEELGIPTENLTNNDQRKAAIEKKEAELAAEAEKEKAAQEESEKAELVEKAENLGIEDAGDLSKEDLEASISKKEEELKNIEVQTKKETAAVYEDNRGLKWEFKKSAPKTINIDGRPMTQAEILESEDVISGLVYGNSNFLTPIIH